MNKIIEFAINHAILINPKNLVNAVKMIDEYDQERFAEVALGIVDLDELESSLPKKVILPDKSVGTRTQINYVRDRVMYTHEVDRNKYFKTEEDAASYSAGNVVVDCSYRNHDNYTYLGTRKEIDSDYCGIECWKSCEASE